MRNMGGQEKSLERTIRRTMRNKNNPDHHQDQ